MKLTSSIDKDLYTIIEHCIRCGQCTYTRGSKYDLLCPMYKKGKFFAYSGGGIVQLARALFEKVIDYSPSITNIIYRCTTCGICEEMCGVITFPQKGVSPMDIGNLIKAELVKRGLGPLPPHKRFYENIVKEHTPYDDCRHEERTAWMPPEIRREMPEKAEVLYFVGCTASFREQDIARSFINILRKAGVNFTVSRDEWCCGSPMYRTGQWDIVKDLVKHNVEMIKKTGASTVVFTCAGCYNTLKKHYPEWYEGELGVEMLHASEFVVKLIKDGRLSIKKPIEMNATYHDPCHLGRGVGVYEPPRELIKLIKGLKFTEMERSRENAFCCGAGGGVKGGLPDYALEIATDRIKEALKLGVNTLISTCPFCKRNLKDAVQALKVDMNIIDLMEILDKVT